MAIVRTVAGCNVVRSQAIASFEIRIIECTGIACPVQETIVDSVPFCVLRRFAIKKHATHVSRSSTRTANMLCAPLAGHHAVMLREAVETLLHDGDVTSPTGMMAATFFSMRMRRVQHVHATVPMFAICQAAPRCPRCRRAFGGCGQVSACKHHADGRPGGRAAQSHGNRTVREQSRYRLILRLHHRHRAAAICRRDESGLSRPSPARCAVCRTSRAAKRNRRALQAKRNESFRGTVCNHTAGARRIRSRAGDARGEFSRHHSRRLSGRVACTRTLARRLEESTARDVERNAALHHRRRLRRHHRRGPNSRGAAVFRRGPYTAVATDHRRICSRGRAGATLSIRRSRDSRNASTRTVKMIGGTGTAINGHPRAFPARGACREARRLSVLARPVFATLHANDLRPFLRRNRRRRAQNPCIVMRSSASPHPDCASLARHNPHRP